MCGIFGFVRQNPTPVARSNDYGDFIAESFQAGQVRGTHGSGLMVLTDKFKVDVDKAAVCGTQFLAGRSMRTLAWDSLIMMGHNRYTTTGVTSDAHCHPFTFGPVTGVHNGHINFGPLNVIDKDRSHEVDSGRIMAALSKTDDAASVLAELESGSYMLAWYDARIRALRMARNDARPMYMVQSNDHLLFASESGMLKWLGQRNDLIVKGDTLMSLDIHTLYTFPIEDLALTTAVPYKPVEIPPWTGPANAARQSYHDWWDGETEYSWQSGRGNYRHIPPARAYNQPGVAPQRVRKFYSMHSLSVSCPKFKGEVEELEKLTVEPPATPAHAQTKPHFHVVVYGNTIGAYSQPCMFGAIVDPISGDIQNTAITIHGTDAVLQEIRRVLPTKRTKDAAWPVIRVGVDVWDVLPTGDLIPRSIFMVAPGTKLEYYLTSVADEDLMYAHEATNLELVNSFSDEKITELWASMNEATLEAVAH